MEPMWHPCWDPLWEAVNEVELPLHFHTFPTTPPQAREQSSGLVRRAAMFTGVSAFQMGLIHIVAAIIGAGVFDRYPKLKIALGESGVGWLPYALDRMDFEFEDRFRDLMKKKPSEYWQEHCKATFQYDVIGPMLINTNNLLTEGSLMWGSDYPHTDGIWPESTKYIEEQFAGLTAAQIKKITCDNAVEFYGLNKN
jgi:predicted TIM-barrel fold metal-dependent hydrolase